MISFEELRIIVIVYLSALLPIILIYLKRKDVLSSAMIRVYILSFLICSLGWELWFTFGWFEGDSG